MQPDIPPGGSVTLAPLNLASQFDEPSMKLGGIGLPAQGFSWSFVPGAAPFRTNILANPEITGLISKIENPTTLSLKMHGEIAGRDERVSLNIHKVYIQEPRKINAFQTVWEVADRRREIVGHTTTLRANITWRLNDFGSGFPSEIGPDDPAILREQFDRFQQFRYLPFTKNPATGLPWTAHQLLLKVLGDEFGEVQDFAEDNGYIQENIEWEERPTTQVITDLAGLAREEVGILPNGNVYVYPAVDLIGGAASVIPLDRPPMDAGVIYRSDLSRTRPTALEIRYKRLQETLIVNHDPYAESIVPNGVESQEPIALEVTDAYGFTYDQEDIDDGKVVGCFNVVQLPVDMDINLNGVVTRCARNTWAPMVDYLAALELDELDVRRLWFTSLLETWYAGALAEQGDLGQLDPLRLQHIAAVRQHYRRSWQIDPYWVQRWDSWATTRCTITDIVTRYQAPSPLWANYCIIPKVRQPQQARYPDLWKAKAYNVLAGRAAADGGDADIDGQTEAAYTAGTIRLVDDKLGIFRTEYPTSVDQTVAEIIPCAVDNLPTSNPDANRMILQGSRLSELHKLETMISVSPRIGPDDDFRGAYTKFPVIPSNAGKGPVVEYLSRLDVARYPMLRGLTEQQRADAEAAISAGLPINTAMLAAIAHVEAKTIMHTHKDRLTGFAVFPGCDVNKLQLFGNCRGITVEASRATGLRTSYDMTIPPTAPDLVQQGVPESVQRFVQRRLPQEA